MLYPHQWKKGKITNRTDIHQISQTLEKLLTDVRQIILDMMSEGNVDIFLIPDKLNKLRTSKVNFIEYCEMRASIRKYGKSLDSQKRYDRFLRLFKTWGKIIEFSDISESNIITYDRYLHSRNMKPYSIWNNYHRFLNSFITDAIDEGLLTRNPYKWLNIDKCKTSEGINKYLTLEEFHAIKNSSMPTNSLEKVRDLFVFQTYTCLAYSDLASFSAKNIQYIKDTPVYIGNRHKTSKGYTIPILFPAMDILRKYNFHLPVISNVKYNEYLKVVAQAAGIDKPISTHWARHTGATLLLNEGVDMRIVSKICGHSSTRITEQVYAKLLDETVVDAVYKVEI